MGIGVGGWMIVMHLLKRVKLALAICSFMVLLPLGQGQRYLGGIQGEVTDTTGAKVTGAVVTAEETSTHFKSTVTANTAGSYAISSLNPGTYTVTSAAPS